MVKSARVRVSNWLSPGIPPLSSAYHLQVDADSAPVLGLVSLQRQRRRVWGQYTMHTVW